MELIWIAGAYVAGVVTSETARRLWNAYVAPKVAEIKARLQD